MERRQRGAAMEAKEHNYGVVGEPAVVAASPRVLSGIGGVL
jgi:hypothetical protein